MLHSLCQRIIPLNRVLRLMSLGDLIISNPINRVLKNKLKVCIFNLFIIADPHPKKKKQKLQVIYSNNSHIDLNQ